MIVPVMLNRHALAAQARLDFARKRGLSRPGPSGDADDDGKFEWWLKIYRHIELPDDTERGYARRREKSSLTIKRTSPKRGFMSTPGLAGGFGARGGALLFDHLLKSTSWASGLNALSSLQARSRESPGLCEPGTPCFAMALGVSISLCFSTTSGVLKSCSYATGDSLLGKGIWRLGKSLLFRGLWRFENSPPATEVWFRCAPPHVASLIHGNGLIDRKLLMSEGAAAASSCVAGPLSPGVKFQK